MCNVFGVSSNAYYHWRNTRVKKNTRTAGLKEKIKEIYEQNRQCYGSPRISKALEEEGFKLSRSYVARLMRQMGLQSRIRKKWVITTQRDETQPVAENLLNRQFDVNETGKVWVSDITYIRLGQDWAYLTTMIDLADRAVVGWSVSEDMTTENTLRKTWMKARKKREIKDGFMLHSDRGIQYTCGQTRSIFEHHQKARQSMSRKGNCWDNAVAESFFKTIKYEELNHHTFNSIEQIEQVVEQYIHWYNNKRLHSSIGYKTPLKRYMEINHHRKMRA